MVGARGGQAGLLTFGTVFGGEWMGGLPLEIGCGEPRGRANRRLSGGVEVQTEGWTW